MSKTKKKLRREPESGSEDAASAESDSDSSGSNTSSSSSSSSSSSGGEKKTRKKSSKVKKSKSKPIKDKKLKKRKHKSSDSDSDDSSSSSSSSSSDDGASKKKKHSAHTDTEEKKTKRKDLDQFEIEAKRPDGRRSPPETKRSGSMERGGDGGNCSKWDSPGRDGRRGVGGYQNSRNFDRRSGNNWNRGWNNDWRNNRDNGYRGRDGFSGGRDRDFGRDRRDDGPSFRGGRHQDERWRNDDRGRNDDRVRNDYRDRRPYEREDDRERGGGGGGGGGDRSDARVDRDREFDREREPERRRSRSRSPRRPRNFPRRNEDSDKEFQWGGRKDDTRVKKEEEQSPTEKEKPNFGLSGKLTEDTNTVNGVVVKYAEPPEARKPKRRWRLYPFKGEKALPTLHIHRQSCFLIGRDRKVCDLPVDHPSCSKQHAALQYRLVPFQREDGTTGRRVRPYIIDLESANGTFLNSKKIDPKRYVELIEKDVLKFGFSSREYVLLHENSKEDEDDDDVKQEDDDIQVKEEPE